jgi:RNA polymerase sigma-70 factor, ECF subfamily
MWGVRSRTIAGSAGALRTGTPHLSSAMSSTTATYTDVELVELARGGDRPAFDELLLRHDERMRGLAFRLLADPAAMDDALQESYLTAYKGLPGLRPGKDFGGWLYRITYNACIDEIRRRKKHGIPIAGPAPGQAVSTSEVVRQALADLPAAQRVTVVLVDGEGFDHEEAADILGVAPGQIASRLYRARTALRRRLWDEVR